MRVRCSHGYFFFDEVGAGDIAIFSGLFGLELIPKDWYYTFPKLLEAPDYSIAGASYEDPLALTTKNFAGNPWDVMRENKIVFDYSTLSFKPIASILVSVAIYEAELYYFSDTLLLPGSINSKGKRVTDFTGYFPPDGSKFRYTEVLYDYY